MAELKYTQFHIKLHDWYEMHGRRDLPWRNTRDPYQIYLSEVMLQQTQVKTVLERFYFPFLKRFPTLQALADAPREAVLKQWEGLGYYNRAANLHRAAQMAAPVLPDTVEELESLPGVGKNTAHAVAAFAYHRPVPVMEANVKRVLSRMFAMENPSAVTLWEHAWALLDTQNPFDYNQAMMDIGSLVCSKTRPQCLICPAQDICEGKETPECYPARKQKKEIPIRKGKFIVWKDGQNRYRLQAREGAFLNGLYGFAEYPAYSETVTLDNVAYVLEKAGRKIGEVTQTYSHFRMEGEVWLIELKDRKMEGTGWFIAEEIALLALSGIDHKVWKMAYSPS